MVDAVYERLKLIRTSVGYQTDLGLKPHKWKVNNWSPSEMPGFSLNDVSCEVSQAVSGTNHWTITFDVEVHQTGSLVPEYLLKAEADIVKAIWGNPTFPETGFSGRTNPLGGFRSETRIVHNEYVEGAIKVSFQIVFATPLRNPYV